MQPDNEIDEYTAKIARDKRKKAVIAVLGGAAALGALYYLSLSFLTPASTLVEYINTEAPPQEQFVIEAMEAPARRALLVESEPAGASIIVNGIPSQRLTPASVDVVEGARNTISLYHTGYRTRHTLIEADEGDLHVTLTPYVAPARPDSYLPPTDDAGKPLPEEPVHGRVRVSTRSPQDRFDGATIWLNGQRTNEPSPAIVRVQANDEAHILVRHTGYLDAIAFVQAMPFGRTNDERDLLLEMQVDRGNAYSALSIRTFPRDAKVWLDDEEITGNIITPVARNRHFTIRAEAPGHDSWERTFDATVGTIELSIQLQRPINPPGSIFIAGLPENVDAYLIPQREGAEGGTQIGNKGRTEVREVEGGKYTLRISWSDDNRRLRKDFDIEVVPNEHRTFTLDGTGSRINIASTSNRKPRN